MTPSTSRVLTHPLAFIGGGNMARSLIGGLIKRGADPSRIRVAEPNEPLRAALAADFGVQVFTEAGEAAPCPSAVRCSRNTGRSRSAS